MAQIDGSIYFQQETPDIFGSIQKGLNMRDQMDQRALQRSELEKQKKIQEAYKSGITQNPDGSVAYDAAKTTANLFGIDPNEARKAQQLHAEQQSQEQQRSREKALFEAEAYSRETAGVKDQTGWNAAADRLKASGVDMRGWDPIFDPKKHERYTYAAMTTQQRLAQQNADRDYKLKQEEVALKRQEAAVKKAEAGANGRREGIKALDKDYAKDFNDFTANGVENARASIAKLKSIRDELVANKDAWTSGGGRMSSLPDGARNRDSIRWRDQAQSAANSTLKAIFGGGLSDDERKAAASEYYNDGLGNEENAKILTDKIATAELGLQNQINKAAHFQKFGTLEGFSDSTALTNTDTGWESSSGKMPSIPVPEVGASEGGYRFKGGNPSDPKSWEKI